MPDIRKNSRQLNPRDYVLCYVLYLVVIGLAFVVAFVIWPPAIVALTVALTNSMWVHRGVYPFSMVLLGMGWLGLVLTAEGYLRHGLERQQLGLRFRRLSFPLVAMGVFGLVVAYLSA